MCYSNFNININSLFFFSSNIDISNILIINISICYNINKKLTLIKM